MGHAAFAPFCDEVAAALDELYGPATIDRIGGWATVGFAGQDVRISLAGLAQGCAGLPERRWRDELRRGLREVDETCRLVAAFEIDDRDAVCECLRAKVVPTAALRAGSSSPPPCAVTVTDDLSVAAFVDLGVCRWPLAAGIAEGWGADPAEVARCAAQRTASDLVRPSTELSTGAPTALMGRDASALIAAPRAVLPPGTTSCLIAVPNSDLALVLALADTAATDEHIGDMRATTVAAHDRWAHPLSPHLYRWTPIDGARRFVP